MKSTRMFAIASVMTAISAAWAQAPAAPAAAATAAPAPATAPATAAATAPATAPPKLDQKAPPRAARVSIVDADARKCLEFPSNEEVIRCAEKYLHRRAG